VILLRQPRRATPPERRRILVSACHARHLEVQGPLARALSAAGVATEVVAGTVNGPELARRLSGLGDEGIAWSFLVDRLPRSQARSLVDAMRPVARRLAARWTRERAGAVLAGHGGAALFGVIAPYAATTFRFSLPVARLYQEAAERALDATRPEAVVIASDRRPAERALALAAHARQIPTLLYWGSALLARDRINRFDVGHRILVLGEDVRARLLAQGVDGRRIAVVGDPRADIARRIPRDELRAHVRSAVGLRAGERPLIVLVSKYVSMLFSPDEKAALYRTMRQALGALGDADVVVKVHPNEDQALLREQTRAWGWPEACLTQSYDIHRLFRAADAAVMVTSMAGIEAMALGCPVVAVQTPDKDFEGTAMPPYVSERAVERVDLGNAGGLARTLQHLLHDRLAREDLAERGRKFAARYVHPVDGRLADRLLDLVSEVRAELTRRA
jgi:UDP-N-acetylglucosamine 2-epimerase